MAREGLGFTLSSVADRIVADGLVRSGHLVEVEGVDGGYQLSDELARAHVVAAASKAETAVSN